MRKRRRPNSIHILLRLHTRKLLLHNSRLTSNLQKRRKALHGFHLLRRNPNTRPGVAQFFLEGRLGLEVDEWDEVAFVPFFELWGGVRFEEGGRERRGERENVPRERDDLGRRFGGG